MSPTDRIPLHRELRSIKRWLVVVAILVAGVLVSTQSNLSSGRGVLFTPLVIVTYGTVIGGPLYLVVSLFRDSSATERDQPSVEDQ